jgi:hypothetical protein
VSYNVLVNPGVNEDIAALADEQTNVPKDWRLRDDEIQAAVEQAVKLIAALRTDPYAGEQLQGRKNTRILDGCRRLKFDPRDPPPRGRPRMRLVWINEPDEATIERVHVLSVTHRYDSRAYRRAAQRLGKARRRDRD